MLPDNVLKLIPQLQPFANYNDFEFDPFIAYCRGGISIGDISKGNNVVDWKLSYDAINKKFTLTNTLGLINDLGSHDDLVKVKNVSLAFDQNMQLCWSYSFTDGTQSATAFNWFDPTVSKTTTTIYPNTKMSRILLDDPRITSSNINDIIIFYIRSTDNVLCYRYQRERYAKEYTSIQLDPTEEVLKAGFTSSYRVQLVTIKNSGKLVYSPLLGSDDLPLLDHHGNPLWACTKINF